VQEIFINQLESQIKITAQYQHDCLESFMNDSKIVSDILLKQQDASYMLETLICDLLDLAKIENNKFDLNLKYYDLTKSIQNTLKIMMFQAN